MENRPWRISEPAFCPSVRDLLEIAGYAGKGAAGASGAGEPVEGAAELRPEFGTGGLDVGAPVGGVVELVGPDCVTEGFGVAFGFVVVVFGVFVGDCLGGGEGLMGLGW